MRKLLLFFSFLLLSSCQFSSVEKFERNKKFFLENSEEIKNLGKKFYNENSLVSIARVDFGPISGNEVIYHIFSVEKTDENFSVDFEDASTEEELQFWNKDFSLIKNKHGNLTLDKFLKERNIDSVFFVDCVNFLIKSEIRLINKVPSDETMRFEFEDESGFVYYPNTEFHHSYDPKGWRLDDHWYYYEN